MIASSYDMINIQHGDTVGVIPAEPPQVSIYILLSLTRGRFSGKRLLYVYLTIDFSPSLD